MNHSNIFNKAISFVVGLGVALCSVILATGCTEGLEEDVVDGNAVITLTLDEAFQDKVYVRLTHTGGQNDFWVYAVSENLNATAKSLLDSRIAAAEETCGHIIGNVGTNRNITLDSLKANTSYKVAASRVRADGTLLGNAAELIFKTKRDPNVFELHPDWSIVYKNRNRDNLDAERDVFSCLTGGSKDTYVPCLLEKSVFESAYDVEYLRPCFEDYVAFRNSERVKWPKVVVSGDYEYSEDRLPHGEYILFMVGITAEGELTGYYAINENCVIEQEKASVEYRKWIGIWTLSGKCDNTKITYQVEITPEENNLYYRMSGWESTTAANYFKDLPTERPIRLYFEKSSGCVYVVSEQFEDFGDETMAEFYDFNLYGSITVDYDGSLREVVVDAPGLKLAKFTLVDDNRAVASPMMFEYDSNGTHYEGDFVYFNYSYVMPLYDGSIPVTTDSIVPRIETITLTR